MAATPSFPVTPPRGARTAQVATPPMNPTDFARAIEIFVNHATLDMRIHPSDLAELLALAASIKASSNNL
jgi:hypothetical protein